MLRSYQLSTHKGYSDKFFIHFIKIIKNIHDVLHLLIKNKLGHIFIKNTFYVYECMYTFGFSCIVKKSRINGILLPKLFLPTVRKNCSSDREKLLKFKAKGREFAKNLK